MELADKFSFHLPGTNGKGVMLIHGLTGIPAEMKLVARQFNRAGYTVYAPLLAGHGVDVATLIKTNWQDWLASTVAAAKQFRTEVSTLYTAGICVGGKLGMLAAEQEPGLIQAAAIYSPCFRYDGWDVPWYYKLGPIGIPVMLQFPWWQNRTYAETPSLGIKDQRMREFMQSAEAEGVIDDFPLRSLLHMLQLGSALKKKLPTMTTPTAIFHAREDNLSHPRNAIAITKRIAAPHEMHWIEDSYHMIHVDKHHKQVADLSAAFFEKHHAASAA